MGTSLDPPSTTSAAGTPATGSTNSTARAIKSYIVESFILDDSELGPEDSLIDSGVIDSTGVMEIVAFVEQEFGIEIDDRDSVPENFDSVSRLACYVQAKLSQSA